MKPASLDRACIEPGETFPADQSVSGPRSFQAPNGDGTWDTANVSHAGNLNAYGYKPLNAAAWTAGQKVTIGTLNFKWDGTTWVDTA